MKRRTKSLLLAVFLSILFFTSRTLAQVDRITIAAGTDEDHALQTITNEQDAQKKLSMYQDFVQKFSSNPQAVAYGNWQIAQTYQSTSDLAKSLEYGDKALASSPHNLDILVTQTNTAQQAKNNAKLMDYVSKGGEVCQSVAKQTEAGWHERRGLQPQSVRRKVVRSGQL